MKLKPRFWAFYAIPPANGLGLFYSSQGPHGAWKTKAISVTTVQCNTTKVTTPTKRHQIYSVLHAQAYLSAISCSFTLASSSRSSAFHVKENENKNDA